MEPFLPVGYSPLDVLLDDVNWYRLPSNIEGEKSCPGFAEVKDSEANLMEDISDIQDLFDPESLYEAEGGLNEKGRPRCGEISDSEAGLTDGVTEAHLLCELKPCPQSTKTVMTWGTAPFQSAKKGFTIKGCWPHLSGDSDDFTATSFGASSSFSNLSATGMSATKKDFQTCSDASSDFPDDAEKIMSGHTN